MGGLIGRILSRFVIFIGTAILCTIGLAAVFVLVIVSIYFAFAQWLSPSLAALATAFCALLVSGIVMLAGGGLLRTVGRTPRSPIVRERARGSLLGELLGAELIEAIDRHPGKTIASALAIGLVVGISPAARAFLRDFFRR